MNLVKAVRGIGCKLLAVAMLLSLLGHVPSAADTVARPEAGAAAKPQPVGREASAEEAPALDKVVGLFLDALRQRWYLAAWQLLTNTPEGWDCRTWSEKMFASGDLSKNADDDTPSTILLFASERRLVQTKTFGDTGAALFAVDFKAPVNLVLVFREGAWQLDWNASQDMAATNSLNRLSADIQSIRLDTLLRTVMELGVGDFSRLYWGSLTGGGMGINSCETVARRIHDDGRAVVELQTRVEVNVVVPLKLGPGGWIVGMDAKCRVVPADYKLSRSDAPPAPEATAAPTAPAAPPAPPAPPAAGQ